MDESQIAHQYEKQSFEVNIPLYIVLTIFTCGLFNLYWNYRQMETCNYMLKREEFTFLSWILLSIITCGIYHVYYQYKMASAIVEIQYQRNAMPTPNLPILSAILTAFVLSFIVDLIHQSELNKLLR
ncbi:MAG: DUF4234 domain-containing protein [Candidatus Marinimicrobia bacterium]|nr:DUF4234 domain-containing protein [Candidatus Neomarinimicrobiota bacterium]